MAGRVWAVVVARVGSGAKSRLAGALSPADRRRLALAMLSDVLDVCSRAADVLEGTVAVVDDQAARQLAEATGALAVDDSHPGDMNLAVSAGITVAREHGARTVIILPGDVPLISPHDLEDLVSAAGNADRAVVVGARRDGHGTNALLLRPPGVMPPAFGPPSVDRHVANGLANGAVTRVAYHLGLALDVDTSADLAALADEPVGPHTAEALAELWLVRT
jgi:2-phospho-L-lactate/phosphoenolpyruvate guanylyltransferase